MWLFTIGQRNSSEAQDALWIIFKLCWKTRLSSCSLLLLKQKADQPNT